MNGEGGGLDDRAASESAELRRLRRRIDALDRRIVRLLNERADLARDVGREKAASGRRGVRDPEREREVLLRVTMANAGPTPQADLIAIYRRLFGVARTLERRDRQQERWSGHDAADGPAGDVDDASADRPDPATGEDVDGG